MRRENPVLGRNNNLLVSCRSDVLETVGLNAVWILLHSCAILSFIIVREKTFNFSGANWGLLFCVCCLHPHGQGSVILFSSTAVRATWAQLLRLIYSGRLFKRQYCVCTGEMIIWDISISQDRFKVFLLSDSRNSSQPLIDSNFDFF
jgi:hypothetical protein